MAFSIYLHIVLAFLVHIAVGRARLSCNTTQAYCGWELMEQLNIPIGTLGEIYADQTGDDSLCTDTATCGEYCPCVFECGNGIWQCIESQKGHVDSQAGWVFKKGCKKYCHAGVCDG